MPNQCKIFFLTIVGICLLSSCGCSKELKGKDPWTIELNNGGCMDVCVTYWITIENTGKYSYDGIQNVKHLGEKSGKFSCQEIQRLQQIIDSTDWTEFESSYGSPGPGSQRRELSISTRDSTEMWVYYRLEPQGIREIESFIYQLIDSDDL